MGVDQVHRHQEAAQFQGPVFRGFNRSVQDGLLRLPDGPLRWPEASYLLQATHLS